MFKLTDEEQRRFEEIKEGHDSVCEYAEPMSCGAIGGRFTYCFTPTSLGVITKVKCMCGREYILTDFDEW